MWPQAGNPRVCEAETEDGQSKRDRQNTRISEFWDQQSACLNVENVEQSIFSTLWLKRGVAIGTEMKLVKYASAI